MPLHDQLHEIERAGSTLSAVPERESKYKGGSSKSDDHYPALRAALIAQASVRYLQRRQKPLNEQHHSMDAVQVRLQRLRNTTRLAAPFSH